MEAAKQKQKAQMLRRKKFKDARAPGSPGEAWPPENLLKAWTPESIEEAWKPGSLPPGSLLKA
jgi:hypothetical protein